MKKIITGPKTFDSFQEVCFAIENSEFEVTEIVSASVGSVDKESSKVYGVDELGEAWAAKNNIPVKHFDTSLEKIGLSSEKYRIEEMVEYADALIAIDDGEDFSAEKTIKEAKKQKLRIFIYMTVRPQ